MTSAWMTDRQLIPADTWARAKYGLSNPRCEAGDEYTLRTETVLTLSRANLTGCLRREYLGKDERGRSTPSDARADWHQAPRQGFTLRGHRLSSLYRGAYQTSLTLMARESALASSCPKYSHPTLATGAASGGNA